MCCRVGVVPVGVLSHALAGKSQTSGLHQSVEYGAIGPSEKRYLKVVFCYAPSQKVSAEPRSKAEQNGNAELGFEGRFWFSADALR
jgi:hypothetical protein